MMNNPSGAVSMAKMIAKQSPPPIAVNTMADLFLQRNMVREATAFLLEALAGDKADEGPLQTKLLEINLITNPQVGCWDCHHLYTDTIGCMATTPPPVAASRWN
jgi:clathrin heavy chain